MSAYEASKKEYEAAEKALREVFPKMRRLGETDASTAEKKSCLDVVHPRVVAFTNAFEHLVTNASRESKRNPDVERELASDADTILDFVLEIPAEDR